MVRSLSGIYPLLRRSLPLMINKSYECFTQSLKSVYSVLTTLSKHLAMVVCVTVVVSFFYPCCLAIIDLRLKLSLFLFKPPDL